MNDASISYDTLLEIQELFILIVPIIYDQKVPLNSSGSINQFIWLWFSVSSESWWISMFEKSLYIQNCEVVIFIQAPADLISFLLLMPQEAFPDVVLPLSTTCWRGSVRGEGSNSKKSHDKPQLVQDVVILGCG